MSDNEVKTSGRPAPGTIAVSEAEYGDIEEVIYAARTFLMLNEGNPSVSGMPHFENLRLAVDAHYKNRLAKRGKNSALNDAMTALIRKPTKH